MNYKTLPLNDKELEILERILDDRQQIEAFQENAHDNPDYFLIVSIYQKLLILKKGEK